MKIMVVGKSSAGLFRFRGDLMKTFIKSGHSVVAVGIDEDYIEDITKMGIAFKKIRVNNTGMNIFSDLKYIKSLKKFIKEEKPNMIFSYTIKPILYTGLITRKQKNIVLNVMFAGLGRIFVSEKKLSKIIRMFLLIILKKNLKHASHVIFQNIENRNLLVEKKVVMNSQAFVVNGSGINIDEYPYFIKEKGSEPVFLYAARLMPQKGVLLFLESASLLKKNGYIFKVVVAGAFDKSFSKKEKESFINLINENGFLYLGQINNVKEELSNANYVVYPSFYGEGVPRALLEALSCGKPIITSNRPGCKETVTNNNGWMIQNNSVEEFVKIMKKSINIGEKEYLEMCSRSRALAEQKFDVRLINDNLTEIMGTKETHL